MAGDGLNIGSRTRRPREPFVRSSSPTIVSECPTKCEKMTFAIVTELERFHAWVLQVQRWQTGSRNLSWQIVGPLNKIFLNGVKDFAKNLRFRCVTIGASLTATSYINWMIKAGTVARRDYTQCPNWQKALEPLLISECPWFKTGAHLRCADMFPCSFDASGFNPPTRVDTLVPCALYRVL